MTGLLCALTAYLLGSLNTAIIVSLYKKEDIRAQGSGNAGLTNTFRVWGMKWGIIVALGDTLKGIAAVLLGGIIMNASGYADLGRLLGGLFAVLGHIYPIYFKFKGGKGVMTTGAILPFIDWRVFLIAIGIFLLLSVSTRYVSLGSILAGLSLPLSMAFFHDGDALYIVPAVLLAALIAIMHRENIKRLLKGTENKFSIKKDRNN